MEHGYFHFARTTLKNTPYRTEDKASEGSNLEVFMNVNLNVYTNQQLLQSLLERVAAVGYDLHRGDPEPGENILQLINAGKAIAGCA